MNIQIYYSRKCFDSQKAERYFKERKIKYQSIDILHYGLSKGEFQSVKQAVGLAAMINKQSKAYERCNMAYFGLGPNAEEALQNNPEMYNTPIVRNGRQATIGYCPEIWANWV